MISFATDRRAGSRARRDARLRRRARCARWRATATRRRRSPTRSSSRPGSSASPRRSSPRRSAATARARSPVTNAIVLEELAYGDAALAHRRGGARRSSPTPIADQGTDAQRDALLPLLLRRALPRRVAGAWSSRRPASTPSRRAPRAERKGNGFVLSGTKCFVPLADRASHFLVVARSSGDAARRLHRAARRRRPRRIATPEKNLGLQGAADRHADARRRARAGADAPRRRRRLPTCRACSTTRASALAAVLIGLVARRARVLRALRQGARRLRRGRSRRSSRSPSASPTCTSRSSRCAG